MRALHRPPFDTDGRQPMFNLPPMVKLLLIANLAIHGVRLLLPVEIDLDVLFGLGFIPGRYTLLGGWDWERTVTPLSYQFLHDGWAHIGVNMVALMAFGAGVERAIGPWRTLAFYLSSGVAAALAHLIVDPGSLLPLIGASGAISGLFGGVVLELYRRGRIRNWRVLVTLCLVWMAIAVVFGMTGLPGDGDATIAWVAHLGGFVAGLALFSLFRPRRPAYWPPQG